MIMHGTSLRPTTAGGLAKEEEVDEDCCYDVDDSSFDLHRNKPSCTTPRKTTNDLDPNTTSPCWRAGRCVENCAAYGRVCPRAARLAAAYAGNEIARMKLGSAIFAATPPSSASPGAATESSRVVISDEEFCDDDFSASDSTPAPHQSCTLPYLCANDIVIGDQLGEGGFCNVNLCTVNKRDEGDVDRTFAIKYLKRKAMADLHQFRHGAADLALEAHFLNVLDHPHIIKLHGVTAGSVETAVASGKECGFFIVVDKLVGTLEQRIARWHQEEKSQDNNHFFRFSNSYRQKKQATLLARLKIAWDIADALAYMHAMGVIFRDLKPDNIGFDENDNVKLFDFGLAKELKPGQKQDDGKYQLTGNTGSRRYMANEVARGLNYNQSVDVFSFGILLWEMCTTEKPYLGYSSNKHMNLVVLGGERPKMDGSHTVFWPLRLQQLMTSCWSASGDKRPSFVEVKVLLNGIMDELQRSSSPIPSPSVGGGGQRQMVPPPGGGGFSLLTPLSPLRKVRGKTAAEEVPQDIACSTNPNVRVGGRSRSWGFGPK